MNISNITPPQVWTSSSRSLTNIGSGALAATNTAFNTVAGAGSVDLRSGAGTVGISTVACVTGAGATGSVQIYLYDGVNSSSLAVSAAAATSPTQFTTVNTNGIGPRVVNNDATHAASYTAATWVFTI